MIASMPMTSRRLFSSVALAMLAGLAAPAPAAESPIRLIVRGDDMGSSHASNEAVVRCFRDGVMRDLTLTSEWDNVKWRPLTAAPSLVEPDGTFHPMIWPGPHYGKERALKEQPWKLDEIERELRAQVVLTKREVPQLSHLSDHMGFEALGPEVQALVRRLAVEYGLDVDPGALGVKGVGWDGEPATPAEKVESFVRVLGKLGPGTWLFIDHPALDTPEMRATGHVGYEGVALDRQGVTESWTSAAAKEIVMRRGIELVGYKDLLTK
jgi:hypothetical protein